MNDWNQRCVESIQREKKETEKKYNIKIGQTDIYCRSCGRPCIPGQHTCRATKLHEAKKINGKDSDELIDKIKALGRSKTSIMLKIPVKNVSNWIDRGNVPKHYIPQILAL